MRSIIGASLIILSSFFAGMSAASILRKRGTQIEELIRIVRSMETDVCLRQTPLPRVLIHLGERENVLFGCAEKTMNELSDELFERQWSAVMTAAPIPGRVKKELIALGSALCTGEPPDRSFALCLAALTRLREDYRKTLEKNGRLFPTLGAAAGCMIVILLI